ncbi:MAG TPA: hypothetical protein VFP80_03945 [Thermoanaerobaculia bacterium]|nr:hypothetical protein [Thermoanaerobaculia bacterium]
MATFDESKADLLQRREEAAKARRDAASARERHERLRERRAVLARTVDPGQLAQLDAQIAAASAELDAKRADLQAKAGLELAAIGAFGLIADPTQEINRFDTAFPILMMPVRLETRFKSDLPVPQLWVRVYPDDCSIDTFEETLSENEVTNARLYWAGVYAAAGNESEQRGAWRGLVASHGSGRAEWIRDRYQPTSVEPPPKAPGAVILAVSTDAPPPQNEQDALVEYWPAAWLAGEDPAALASARDALIGKLNGDAARADELIAAYVPFNLSTKPSQGVAVSAVFVTFEPIAGADVKRRSWSRGATAELMPDRFVFIGYRRNGSNLVQEVFEVGLPVITPLPVSPDPSIATKEEQLHQDEITHELIVPEAMKWMVDFDRAVDAGMGFRIDLNANQAQNGFDRVLVLGLRMSADQVQGKNELQALFTNHRFGRGGLSIVPQGTPTNNTDNQPSGFSRTEDADASFDALSKPSLITPATNWLDKQDGQWLAELLGLDLATFAKVRNADGRDQADARAMNIALWPATMGYWMESMMGPVFDDGTVEDTREFFNFFVSGRGAVPAIRIGKQPYGILPATAYSRIGWLAPHTGADFRPLRFMRNLLPVLQAMEADWQAMTKDVSFAGKQGQDLDPHQLLLDIVGLHPNSVHLSQRYAESIEQIYNRLSISLLGPLLGIGVVSALQKSMRDLLAKLGFGIERDVPEMMKKFFLRKHHDLKGATVEEALSEADPLRKVTADGTMNYIEWLIDAGGKSIDAVYQQHGFKDNKPPQALLYLLLRHALQLGYHDTSLRFHRAAQLMNDDAVRAARRDDPFVHIRANAQQSESRYAALYKVEPMLHQTLSVGEFIAQSLHLMPARYLNEQLAALKRLDDASTARLERAFMEHVDCCAYRLDAWLLGIVQRQLAMMRHVAHAVDAPPKPGIYLGAYSWLEDLRPDKRVWQDVTIADPDVAQDFAGGPPLRADSTNQGFIHAPSLNHAVAAAVLRNGYISNAGEANAKTLAVNLTSERVRTALGILEGIRGGQSIGALLGYQFERGLHDRHDFGVELDGFLFELRREFPLRSNKIQSTKVSDDDDTLAIQDIEARNVVDGLALVNHILGAGPSTYKFGKTRLPDATSAQAAAINAEADRLVETYDAVADLVLSEGVFQAVQGNYDRVASSLDAFSKGDFPPEPQIVRTPFDGVAITHRVGLHLQSGIDPATIVNPTPRALAEPAVNAWLGTVLPAPGSVGCVVAYHSAAGNALVEDTVTLQDLGIHPADVLPLFRDDRDESSLTELDERVTAVVASSARPDKPIAIRYRDRGTATFSFFEAMPLVRHLRRLLRGARPLQATDLALTNEAKRGDDAPVFVNPQRIVLSQGQLGDVRNDLVALETSLAAPLADPVANRAAILAGADGWVDAVAALFPRVAAFGIPQSGWAFAYDFRTRVFRGVLKKAVDLVARWTERRAAYVDAITAYDALGVTPDEERFRLLIRAEALIAGTAENPVPATPAAYRTLLDGKLMAFDMRRGGFADLQNTTSATAAQLLAEVGLLLPIAPFDTATPFDLAPEEDEHVRFAEDALKIVRVLLKDVQARFAGTTALLAAHGAATTPAAKVQALASAAKVLLGEEFAIVPEVALGPLQATEVASAFGASASLLDHLVANKVELPVDSWLYGVARVRERMHDWEQLVLFAGALGQPEPELTPLQLPFLDQDRWLALDFPADLPLDVDRLLYTAHFVQPFDPNIAPCGLLLDEWTEVLPKPQTTTGVALHYDRPNNEAPQTMLLVTPASLGPQWQWADLVGALHETLDLAKRRAVEPTHIDKTAYAHFLPATIMAVTIRQITMSANLALNNDLGKWMKAP